MTLHLTLNLTVNLTVNRYLENVFKEAPLIVFKRQSNIREALIKAKVAPKNTREKKNIKWHKKCGKCIICSYINEGNNIKAPNYTWKINKKKVSCQDSNVIYLIQCEKERCKQQYIGYTQQEFRERMCQHIGYVRNKVLSKATGQHLIYQDTVKMT